MLGIGIVVGLLGYGLTFWGVQLWNGCTQNSFLDIMWPGGGRFTPCSGSGSSSPGAPPGGVGNPGAPPGATVPGGNSTGTNPFGSSKYGPTSA